MSHIYLFNITLSKEGKLWQIFVQAVYKASKNCQVWPATVIHKMGNVTNVGSVDGVRIVLTLKIQVEQVRDTGAIVEFSATFSLLSIDDLANVHADKRAFLDRLYKFRIHHLRKLK
jgi:hypothetical protein